MRTSAALLLCLLAGCQSLPPKVVPAPCPQPVQIPAELMQPPESIYLLAPAPG